MFVDIHSHIIPDIDDGAQNFEVALEMLRMAELSEIQHIMATPHYIYGSTEYTYSTIAEKCSELKKLAFDEGLKISIHPGCEIFITPNLPELYEGNVIGTLAQSKYMLIELPMMSMPRYIDNVMYKLQLKGVVPVIAHPERYIYMQSKPDILKSMVQRGVLVQINSGSLSGFYGKEAKRAALRFLKMGIAHFVGSDSHNARSRTPELKNAAHEVKRIFGSSVMEDIFYNNGKKVITNEPIDACSNLAGTTKGSFFSSIFNRKKALGLF